MASIEKSCLYSSDANALLWLKGLLCELEDNGVGEDKQEQGKRKMKRSK